MTTRPRRLLSTGEAALVVGVNPRTLQRWVDEGQVFPTRKTAGRHYRWDIEALKQRLDDLDAVITAVVVRDHRVLVTARADRPGEAGPWTLPAGQIAPRETVGHTAMRVVREQAAGLAVTATGELGRGQLLATGQTVIYVRCALAAAVPRAAEDASAEQPGLRWLSDEEVAAQLPDLTAAGLELMAEALQA